MNLGLFKMLREKLLSISPKAVNYEIPFRVAVGIFVGINIDGNLIRVKSESSRPSN
jgi:hypothetical protein